MPIPFIAISASASFGIISRSLLESKKRSYVYGYVTSNEEEKPEKVEIYGQFIPITTLPLVLKANYKYVRELLSKFTPEKLDHGTVKVTKGYYHITSREVGTLVLNAKCDPMAQFLFFSEESVIFPDGTSFILKNDAGAYNVFFFSDKDIVIGRNCNLVGNIIASGTITMGKNSTLNGRLYGLATDSSPSVILDKNRIVVPRSNYLTQSPTSVKVDVDNNFKIRYHINGPIQIIIPLSIPLVFSTRISSKLEVVSTDFPDYHVFGDEFVSSLPVLTNTEQYKYTYYIEFKALKPGVTNNVSIINAYPKGDQPVTPVASLVELTSSSCNSTSILIRE